MPNTIAPRPWQNGLFDAATLIPSSEVDWDGSGWKLYTACPEGAVWCCDDSDAIPMVPKRDPASGQSISFSPFTVYQITGCAEGTSRLPENMTLNDTLAAQWLATNLQGWVSAGLEVGACGSLGLVDLPDLTPVIGPLSVAQAIARLVENRQRDGLFDRPTIHMPGGVFPYISNIDTLLRFVDIAVGPGYGIVNTILPVDNGGWAYITGPVEYALGPEVEVLGADSLTERRRNYDDSLKERLAAVRFDPCGSYRTQFAYC